MRRWAAFRRRCCWNAAFPAVRREICRASLFGRDPGAHIGGWADRYPRIPLKYILRVCLTAAMGITLLFYFVHPGFLGTAVILFLLGIVELNI